MAEEEKAEEEDGDWEPAVVIRGTALFYEGLAAHVLPLGLLANGGAFQQREHNLMFFLFHLNRLTGPGLIFLLEADDFQHSAKEVGMALTSGLLSFSSAFADADPSDEVLGQMLGSEMDTRWLKYRQYGVQMATRRQDDAEDFTESESQSEAASSEVSYWGTPTSSAKNRHAPLKHNPATQKPPKSSDSATSLSAASSAKDGAAGQAEFYDEAKDAGWVTKIYEGKAKPGTGASQSAAALDEADAKEKARRKERAEARATAKAEEKKAKAEAKAEEKKAKAEELAKREVTGDSSADSGDDYTEGGVGHRPTRREVRSIRLSSESVRGEKPAKVLSVADVAILALIGTLNRTWVQNLVWRLRSHDEFQRLGCMVRGFSLGHLLSDCPVADYGEVQAEAVANLDLLNQVDAVDGATIDQRRYLPCLCSQETLAAFRKSAEVTMTADEYR